MRNYWGVIVSILTLGNEGQSFLGAKWVEKLLQLTPQRYRRQMALTVLSWSPHYFIRNLDPAYQTLPHSEFVEREFARNKSTREKLCASVLLPYLDSTQIVLDYGCGPGFLANSVARHVRSVYAVDLSRGVLECARILNHAPDITFLSTAQFNEIEDGSIDLVYSFAVVQHVTDEVFKTILAAIVCKLKSGGKLVLHIVLDEVNWKREEDWKQDKSVKGQLKWKYALNCFKRSVEGVNRMLAAAGLQSIVIRPMVELCPEKFDDVCSQHLVCAVK